MLTWLQHTSSLLSAGHDSLHAVTQPLANDNSGGGQFQLGMAKKLTETSTGSCKHQSNCTIVMKKRSKEAECAIIICPRFRVPRPSCNYEVGSQG